MGNISDTKTWSEERKADLADIESKKLALIAATGGPFLEGQRAFIAYNDAVINYVTLYGVRLID